MEYGVLKTSCTAGGQNGLAQTAEKQRPPSGKGPGLSQTANVGQSMICPGANPHRMEIPLDPYLQRNRHKPVKLHSSRQQLIDRPAVTYNNSYGLTKPMHTKKPTVRVAIMLTTDNPPLAWQKLKRKQM